MLSPLDPYRHRELLFGDIHNHCGISYAHGSLEDALRNARQQLDFCSVTGHADWPDMPEPNERIQYIIDFHREGFARLKTRWGEMMNTLRAYNDESRFVVFPAFEIHSNADGDRTILYQQLDGEIVYGDSIADLHRRLAVLRDRGIEAIAFPHHLAYRRGTRGVNWDTFDPDWAPFVEIVSMHGCSEENENTRPFLHSMGGADWESTVQYGLAQGHVFGFAGNTDHHSAHPGSYGHGVTGLWATGRDRAAIWSALRERRMYALTGDRIRLEFALNDHHMGAVLASTPRRHLDICVEGAGPLDAVDIIKNNRLLRRFSQPDVAESPDAGHEIDTLVYLELGWGKRGEKFNWDVTLGLSAGTITRVEPRFRGREVVSPVEGGDEPNFHESRWARISDREVTFQTTTRGNPNNSTNASQGICLAVRAPEDTAVVATLNGRRERLPLMRLMEGSRTGDLDGTDSPAFRFHRAPRPHEFRWRFSVEDEGEGNDFYYARVRQKNDQWAWSSPIFLRRLVRTGNQEQ